MNSEKLLNSLQKITNLLNQDPMSLYSMIGPKSIQLEITNACNLRCTMCDRWKWDSTPREELSNDDLFSLFDDLSNLGTQHILISGGEPLLRKGFKDIIRYITQKGIKVTVITNGVCLTEDIATTLIQSDATIIISLDGSNEEIYSKIRGRKGLFSSITKNIDTLVRLRDINKKGYISIHFVIQKHNLNDASSFFNLGKKLKVDTISYGIVHGSHIPERDVGFDKEDYSKLKVIIKTLLDLKEKEQNIQIDLRKELIALYDEQIQLQSLESGLLVAELFRENPVPCLSLNYWALIDAFGDVYPCCYAYFDNLDYESAQALRSQLCFGNIRETPFQKIWMGEKFNQFRQSMNPVKIDLYPSVCGNCGSFFFFKEKWDNICKLKQKLNDIYGHLELNLSSIRDIILNCFAKPIDRAPRAYPAELENMIRQLFDF
jgi:MoaA/NifB/PqqE/SkfB family radical SAM enzyme